MTPPDPSLRNPNVTATLARIIRTAGPNASPEVVAEAIVDAVRGDQMVILPVEDADAVLEQAKADVRAEVIAWLRAAARYESCDGYEPNHINHRLGQVEELLECGDDLPAATEWLNRIAEKKGAEWLAREAKR